MTPVRHHLWGFVRWFTPILLAACLTAAAGTALVLQSATVMASGLFGGLVVLAAFLAGDLHGRRCERERWAGYKTRRMVANERAIAEAKLLYAFGEIDEVDLETRVGHLHDWDGTP